MLGLPIRSMLEPRKLVAGPRTTVASAAALMRQERVGAGLGGEDDRLVGIFTERDAVYRVLALNRDPSLTWLSDVMTPDPKTVDPDESFGYALVLMHENGFRHVPVVEHGCPIGVVSARHALDPELEEFTAQTERRRAIRRRA